MQAQYFQLNVDYTASEITVIVWVTKAINLALYQFHTYKLDTYLRNKEEEIWLLAHKTNIGWELHSIPSRCIANFLLVDFLQFLDDFLQFVGAVCLFDGN